MKLARWLAGAILALALASPAVAQRPEVVELRFIGNEAFNRSELESAIATQAPECTNPVYQLLLLCWAGIGAEYSELDTGALEADAFRLKVYYYERGYREAEISSDTSMVRPGEARVTFRIDEGRAVRVTEVNVHDMPEGLRRGRLPLRAGEPFDVVGYEATRDTLLHRLANNGYAHAQVLVSYTIQRETPYEATVSYDVYPGTLARFGEIDIRGTQETSSRLVHRMLAFEEGGLYRRNALLQSQRNLYGLQVYSYADVQAGFGEEPDSVVPVSIRVVEGNMRRVRLGAGLNTVECANVEGQWTSRNFLGDGRRLSVRGRLGNIFMENCGFLVNDEFNEEEDETYQVSLDFSQPWFFGPRTTVGAGLFAERSNVPSVFVRTAYGGYVSLSRSLGRATALTLAYRPERTRLDRASPLFFCVNFVACTFETGELSDLQEERWLSPLTLSFTVDRTNALFSPSAGYAVRIDLEHADTYTGSDFAYSRLLGEASRYTGEQDGLVLAARVRGGIGEPHRGRTSPALGLNPQKRFFAGGANSVRGFDQFRLGPTILGIDAVPHLVNGDTSSTPGIGRAETSAGTRVFEGAGCTLVQIEDGSCDAGGLPDGRFDLRPVGGQVLLEGTLELRFPVPVFGGNLRGAVFVDAGQVWAEPDSVDLGDIVATPGFGFRYQSPIGPLRVDFAFNALGP
ncbi:MAG: BamA/TamA family outer membrane protein, partial [Longimicrobiales bacterium]|nr:BamA/TamA family outer membrane protein [Longimicrobiales bacterium]